MNFNSTNFKEQAARVLAEADIKINGKRPWDIKILNENIYKRIIDDGMLGVGEGYMAGEWECDAIDELTFRVFTKISNVERIYFVKKNFRFLFNVALSKIINPGGRMKAIEVARKHYDIGNDLFKLMLGKTMSYTCAYWNSPAGEAKNLDEAQITKMELVCQKIGLKPGMTVLDIGGGWGSFAKYAAEKYKAKVVNVSNSKKQIKLANEFCKGLAVESKLADYRDIKGKFDRIVSFGMFEHVGYENYRTYMKIASKNLKEDGIFLLHTIGSLKKDNEDPKSWIRKYIFPNSVLPTVDLIGKAAEGLFVMEDWHNFGSYYDKTLMAWFENFNKNWDKIKDKYGETFYKMWKYYLQTCAGAFRARDLQLWQIVFSKKGIIGGYASVR